MTAAIFDCHIHLPTEDGQSWEWFPALGTVENTVKYLDTCNIAGAILMSYQASTAETPKDVEEGNREIARVIEKYPGRFAGAVIVNPNWIDEALQEMEYCRKELGFAWCGEFTGYVGNYAYDTPEFDRVIRKAVELDLVLHIHTKNEDMDRMARANRDATFVIPHFPQSRGEIEPRVDMVSRNSNVYLDICGSAYVRMGVLELAVKRIGAERIMFGSDLTICDPATVIARVQYAGITEEDKEQIFSTTALALLKERGVEFSF